ncbi:SubName: Full=Uncharacterized protein {ECO:0000313/EMBL:CCA71824.1} [Serendipita indica DSM 11827]|nr:SubName: Full=Uncharacterized protein {ECO:0000313/EMBL:CCA71824.1} [Serendipita indica DSM 11827]
MARPSMFHSSNRPAFAFPNLYKFHQTSTPSRLGHGIQEHIIGLENKRRSTLATNDARRLAVLQRHEHKREEQRLELERLKRLQQEEQERMRKEQLRKVAPGFDPSVGALVPKKFGATASAGASTSSLMLPPPPPAAAPQRDVVADLVDQLAALDVAH